MAVLPIPPLTRAELGDGRPAPQQRVRDLRNWDLLAAGRTPFEIRIAETSILNFSGAEGAIMAFPWVEIPPWAPGMFLALQLQARVDGNSAEVWLRDATTGDEGPRIPVTGLTYTTEGVGPLRLAVGQWANTRRVIEVRGRQVLATGELWIRNEDRLTAWYEDDLG